MTIALLLAYAVAQGVAWPAVGAIAVAVTEPGLVLGGAAGYVLWSRLRRSTERSEVAILASMAGELRAGRSLRQALGALGAGHDGPLRRAGRQAVAGVPMRTITPLLGEGLPGSARLIVPAMAMLEASGGKAGPVFEQLATSQALRTSLDRERRAAMAPARLSVGILITLPVCYLIWLAGSGRAAALLADPIGRVLALGGLGFMAAGLATFLLMLRKAQ